MLGLLTRLLLFRLLGRRLVPLLTAVEIIQLLRRYRDEFMQTPARRPIKTVGPARRRLP